MIGTITISGVIVSSVIAIYFFTPEYKKRIEKGESHIKRLQTMIDDKIIELSNITEIVENRRIDPTSSLSYIENKVLNIYQTSSIRIPIDIIEDLHALHLDDEKDIINFIENQRYFWKLENTKKPFKERS